jgi:hypothetical protein
MIQLPTVQQLAADVKTELDKVRAITDKGAAAVLQFNGEIVGKILQHVPDVGPILSDIVTAAGIAAKLVDAIDTIVDDAAAMNSAALADVTPPAGTPVVPK